MENECEALPGVAYPGVRDNRSTINTKTRYDDDDISDTLCVIINKYKQCYHQQSITDDESVCET